MGKKLTLCGNGHLMGIQERPGFKDPQDKKNCQVGTACLTNTIIDLIYFIFFSGFRVTKSQKRGLYVTENVLNFPVTAPGATSVAKLQISNYSPGESPYSVSR